MHQKNPKSAYSILLMRDDCGVRAFRLRYFWVKFFLVFLVILVAACACGAYGTFYYKKRYEVAAQERRELQRTLGENKIRLENLSNEELVGRFTGGAGARQSSAGQSSASNAGGASSAAPTPEDLTRLLAQSGMARQGDDRAWKDEEDMENHPVKVSALTTVFEGDNRLRIQYDLHNQRPFTLIGRCSIALLTRDGALIDVTTGARGVLSFQIARFRKMDILVRLPDNLKPKDIRAVRISAQANDFPLYYKTFPLE